MSPRAALAVEPALPAKPAPVAPEADPVLAASLRREDADVQRDQAAAHGDSPLGDAALRQGASAASTPATEAIADARRAPSDETARAHSAAPSDEATSSLAPPPELIAPPAGEADTAATLRSEPAGSSDPGTAARSALDAGLAAVRDAAVARVNAVPITTGGGGGGGRIETLAERQARLTDITTNGTATSAAAAVPPIPYALQSPPAPTDADPVPGALHRIRLFENRRLDTVTPPALAATSPLGNPLRLDARVRSEAELAAAHRIRAPEPPPAGTPPPRPTTPAGPPPDPNSAEAVAARRRAAEDRAALDLRTALLEPPAPPARHTGGPAALVDREPVHTPPTPAVRTQMRNLYLELLARSEQHASGMFRRIQQQVFGRGAGGGSDAADFGRESFLPTLRGDFERSVRDTARQAGIAAADLDAAAAVRRAEIAAAETAGATAVASSAVSARDQLTAATERRAIANAEASGRLHARADSVAAQPTAGIGGGVVAVRDRLLGDLRAREAGIDARYRLALDRRERECDDAATRLGNAYRAGAQVDRFQLGEFANLSDARKSTAVTAYVTRLGGAQPATAGTLTATEAEALALNIDSWGQDSGATARATLNGYKTTAQTTTRTNREALRRAGYESTEEVRNWAAEQLGESRGLFTRLLDLVRDWCDQLHANADAWREAQDAENNARNTDDMAMLLRAEEAERAGVGREAILDGNTLTAEQRDLVDRYFSPRFRDADGNVDVVALMTDRAVERIFQSRQEGLVSGLTTLFTNETSLSAGAIERLVGGSLNQRAEAIHAAMFGRSSWNPFSGAGTDEAEIYRRLGGLTSIQTIGLRKVYRKTYRRELESDLGTELSGSEMDRARDLLSGDVIAAAAAALHTAMHGVNWVTGAGTDEAAVHEALRSVPAEQRPELERVYRERYGRDLSTDLEEELNDWATISTSEADRAAAEMRGDDRTADAIELHQLATETIFHTSTVSEMQAVYTRIDAEVEAEVERARARGVVYSSAWVANEIARRRREVERLHDVRYATTDASGARSGTLRQEFTTAANAEAAFWGSTPDHRDAGVTLLNALADNNTALADASILRLERTSILYADDTVITGTYRSQYTRALAEVRRDREEGIRRRLMEELDRTDVPPNQLTPAQRFAREREIDTRVERELQTLARGISEGRVTAMESAYAGRFHESAALVVEENTSGTDMAMARSLRTQGGWLAPNQALEYASRGPGTREEAMIAATAGLTRAEIAELDRYWQSTHTNDDGTPQTLAQLGDDELSGADLGRYRIAIMGVPQTIEEEVEVLGARLHWEMPTSEAGAEVAVGERELMQEQYRELLRMRGDPTLRTGMYRTDLSRAERDAYVGGFVQQASVANTAVDTYRDVRNAIVDEITTAIGVVIGVIVGAILTVFTGGLAAAALIAIIGSLVTTAATMGTKYLLLGNNYGSGDIAMDVAMGLIDAVVSGLTAGMGGRLMGEVTQGAKSAATAITARGLRGALQRVSGAFRNGVSSLARTVGGNEGFVTRLVRPSTTLSEMVKAGGMRAAAARFGATMIENLVQSAPSAVVGAVVNDDVWENGGNPLAKIVSGTAQALGPGLVIGAGMHVGMGVGSRLSGVLGDAWRLARGRVDLDADVHAPRRVAVGSDEYHSRLADYQRTWGSEAETRLRADLEIEHADASRRFALREEQRAPVREAVGEMLGPDRSLAAEVPVAVVSGPEFRRLNGLRAGDAMVHVGEDGQVRIVVREGAPPAAVRRALADHLPALREVEPGTGGRIRATRLEAVLPRDLRGRLPVSSDPTLPPRSVRVTYDPAGVHPPRLVLGPGVRAVDVATHLATARNLLQLHGAFGRVRALLDRVADFIFLHGDPPPGTRAFEAAEELRKLPQVIDARAAELQRGGLSEHQRAAIEADIAHLHEQLDTHRATLAAMDLDPGRGFIAAEGRPAAGTRPDVPLAELDARHAAFVEQLRTFARGEGPPPLPFSGEAPRLSERGAYSCFDPREAYAAYRRAVRDTHGDYEVGIFRDRTTGEYQVLLGRRGSVAEPGSRPGASWETVLHNHPNAEGATRYTLPAQQDLYLAMLARARAPDPRLPHVEFVESVINGQRTIVAAVNDAQGFRLELGRGAGGVDAPRILPIRSLDDYLAFWRSHSEGTPPRIDADDTTFIYPESQEYRAMLRTAAREYGHTDVAERIAAGAPETDLPGGATRSAGPRTMAGTLPDPAPLRTGAFASAEGRVDTARLRDYPRTPITDSPLHGRDGVDRVRRVGGEWHEDGDGPYRHVEAVDGNGVVVASYAEIRNKNGDWVMRGSEINQQGTAGEIASRTANEARLGPLDFVVHGQNASGQGFDQVRVVFDPAAIEIVNGVPRLRDPNYVPTLVLGEDKFMASVSLESITAIRSNLISNLVDKLMNRVIDWDAGALHTDLSSLRLTSQFQADMLARALWNRRFAFEITLANDASLAPLASRDGVPRAAGDERRLVLRKLRDEISAALGGLPVNIERIVLTAEQLAAARAAYRAERGIGARTAVDTALGTRAPSAGDPGFRPTPAQLQAGHLATLADSSDVLPSRLAAGRDGELRTADGRPVRVLTPDPTLRSIMPLGDAIRLAMRTVHDPLTGSAVRPVVVIDVTGFTPAHFTALRAYLDRFGRVVPGPASFPSIIGVDRSGHRAGPVHAFPAEPVP